MEYDEQSNRYSTVLLQIATEGNQSGVTEPKGPNLNMQNTSEYAMNDTHESNLSSMQDDF